MLFAEAVTFDPELVITFFVIFLLVCCAALVVVVVGLCTAFRAGREPSNARAATAWHVCISIECLVVASMLAGGTPLEVLAVAAALPCATLSSYALGRRTALPKSFDR